MSRSVRLVLALAAGLAAASWTLAKTTNTSVRFSDPSKPGTLRIFIANGDVTVTGNPKAVEVSVTSTVESPSVEKKRDDGLRVIGGASAFVLAEKDNVAVLDYGRDNGPATRSASFAVEVPANTNVTVENAWGGVVALGDLDGDVEVKSLNGPIKLQNLGGAAVVETMNGHIDGSFSHVQAGKPLSFSSMNGEVRLHVPADAKASVRLRTQNGTILTDFDEKALVTHVESAGSGDSDVGVDVPDADDWNDAAQEAARAASEIAREAARTAAEAMRQAAKEMRAARNGSAAPEAPEAPAAPQAPQAPKAPRAPRPPSIPAISGGRVISGELNGGGVELQVSTMNGDIVLRRVTATAKSQ